MARPRREDVPAAVRELLAAWAGADAIDRSIASRNHGAPPDPAAVPYAWLKWKLRGMVGRRQSEQATYNALRRTIARMEDAGEVATWWFQDTGRCAWVLLQMSVTKPEVEERAAVTRPSSELRR